MKKKQLLRKLVQELIFPTIKSELIATIRKDSVLTDILYDRIPFFTKEIWAFPKIKPTPENNFAIQCKLMMSQSINRNTLDYIKMVLLKTFSDYNLDIRTKRKTLYFDLYGKI